MSYIAKKCILLNWNKRRPPSFNLFKQILNETLRHIRPNEQGGWLPEDMGLVYWPLTLPYHNRVWHAYITFTKDELWTVTMDWFDLICSIFCCSCYCLFCVLYCFAVSFSFFLFFSSLISLIVCYVTEMLKINKKIIEKIKKENRKKMPVRLSRT